MKLQEMLRDYIRTSKNNNGLIEKIYVCKISWDSPHTANLVWELYKNFSEPIDKISFERELEKILDNKRYFETCDSCGIKKASGNMNGKVCHSCMEKTGIVF